MNPKVSSEACLTSMESFAALLQRLGISSNHSYLGISMLAIAATALAACFLTTAELVPKLARIASLTNDLKVVSRFAQ